MMQLTCLELVLASLVATQIFAYRHKVQDDISQTEVALINHAGIAQTSKAVNDTNITSFLDRDSSADVAANGEMLDSQAEEDAPAWAAYDANAFAQGYLSGFSMTMKSVTPVGGTMKWTKVGDGGMLKIALSADDGGVGWFTGQISKVTRKDIVPTKDGTPASHFGYARFHKSVDGQPAEKKDFRYGGFFYFATEADMKKGQPMNKMNILDKTDDSRKMGLLGGDPATHGSSMRFKQGLGDGDFFQLIRPDNDKFIGLGKYINFPPDFSKDLLHRLTTNAAKQFTLHIPKGMTSPWFGAQYSALGPPAADQIQCDFDRMKCKILADSLIEIPGVVKIPAAHPADLEYDLRRAPPAEGPLHETIGNSASPSGPRACGTATPSGSRWWPVTAQNFIDAGACHYTWIQPGELGSGGFIYHMSLAGGKTMFLFFEMQTTLCSEIEGDTAYDTWMAGFLKGGQQLGKAEIAKRLKNDLAVKKKMPQKTLVFVIDMQKDFVSMNFQMPCARKREALTAELGAFIKKQHDAGATIVASLDYHPKGHCGLSGNCENKHGPWQTYKNSSMTTDEAYYSKALPHFPNNGRYKNEFPPHCEWIVGKDGRSAPLNGAHFDPVIGRVLHDLARGPDDNSSLGGRVHTVFKGFSSNKDSFSALATQTTASEETANGAEISTGGYAMTGEAGDGDETYKSWPQGCYGPKPPAGCFPTAAQLTNPSKATKMWPVEALLEVLEATGKFDRVIVTGLVFDFCVKETAFNAKKLFPRAMVTVPIDLARPACEGGQVPNFAYAPAGLGTTEIIERTEKEYTAREIHLVKSKNLIPK